MTNPVSGHYGCSMCYAPDEEPQETDFTHTKGPWKWEQAGESYTLWGPERPGRNRQAILTIQAGLCPMIHDEALIGSAPLILDERNYALAAIQEWKEATVGMERGDGCSGARRLDKAVEALMNMDSVMAKLKVDRNA